MFAVGVPTDFSPPSDAALVPARILAAKFGARRSRGRSGAHGSCSLDRDAAIAAKAAPLRIYLGAAPGVGKTFAMLSEGRRRAERGTKVVVATAETYGRPRRSRCSRVSR